MTTPRGDGVINVAVPYADSGQVTSTNLNDIVDDAEFNTNAVDDSSVGINGSGKLFVKDDGITTARILNSNVTTAKIADSNVTKAKIENVANLKVLGNTSGSAAAPQEVTINDTDNMSDASATTIATSESIKAYVDSQTTDNLPYVIFNTLDARDGQSQEKWQNWAAVQANTDIGVFSGTGGATDANTEFTFAATGTYYVEFSTLFKDNDDTAADSYKIKIAATKAGTAIQLGPSIDLILDGFYYETQAAASTYSKNISFKYTVSNTTNDRLCFFSVARSSADLASWEAYGAVKITKIS
tara:strand:+ start:4092 stop:4988 length:897 start_codon:yes stop_codon:yes gene_type:complete